MVKDVFETNQLPKDFSDKVTQRIQLVREGKSKIVCRTIWLILTRKCPLECRHCYLCGSRDGESITLPQVTRIIKHLPSGIESLGITGGEPFTNKKLLYETLKLVKKRNFPNLTNIDVQTIGFWARNRAYAKKVIQELIDLGVNSFYIYGHDKWHWEAGLNKERQEMVVDVLKNEFNAVHPEGREDVERIFQGNRITYSLGETKLVNPLGRATWATNPEEWNPTKTDILGCHDFLYLKPTGYIYTINFNGEVHHGICLISRSLGNITLLNIRLLRYSKKPGRISFFN